MRVLPASLLTGSEPACVGRRGEPKDLSASFARVRSEISESETPMRPGDSASCFELSTLKLWTDCPEPGRGVDLFVGLNRVPERDAGP